jgi:hypothetical protein
MSTERYNCTIRKSSARAVHAYIVHIHGTRVVFSNPGVVLRVEKKRSL